MLQMRYNLRNVFSLKKIFDEKFFNKTRLYFILSCISFLIVYYLQKTFLYFNLLQTGQRIRSRISHSRGPQVRCHAVDTDSTKRVVTKAEAAWRRLGLINTEADAAVSWKGRFSSELFSAAI